MHSVDSLAVYGCAASLKSRIRRVQVGKHINGLIGEVRISADVGKSVLDAVYFKEASTSASACTFTTLLHNN